MIRIKVSELMGRHRINQKRLSEITGIRPNTVSALWHGTAKRIDFEQMDKLCEALDCQPSDLFEHIPDSAQ
ncbi:helix-turn-helix domain-containing protein [Alicyclobacillus fastidiosus]|uniref:Helix-turn-helix transcriptional regulator n=1 Tax=Alicyclobacillus fastidiosus TaxID=392011 RepID=A0ABV5AKX8_9BACL